MIDYKINSPVAFIIFNRPETTQKVFAAIAKAKPSKLLVIADGPRADREGEAERCAETRKIIDGVDWPCEVLTNYSDINLGCKNRVSSGLDWVFEQVPEAIILEDDCLPDPTFFQFCEEMLIRYRDDQRIAMISGDNFQFGRKRGDDSYYFSRYTHIWGWASWRRAWQHYDKDASIWPVMRDNGFLEGVITDRAERRFWTNAFQSVFDGKIDTWDYQWVLTAWSQGMLSIMPNVNLISNIGFGPLATHTHVETACAALPVEAMTFPMKHPRVVLPNYQADRFTANGQFTQAFSARLINKLKRLFKSLL